MTLITSRHASPDAERQLHRRLAAIVFTALLACTSSVHGADPDPQSIAPPPAPGPATGLADSAALRATVFGTPPQNMAPMPNRVPLAQIDIALPWKRPVP